MSTTHIAILGDLHGHITLAYRLLKRWEVETGNRLDAIFQVGDFGAFPPPFKVDKATMRFSQKDPDELSFVDYYEGSAEADEILSDHALPDKKIDADMYFVKGNHEDYQFLGELPPPEFGYPPAADAYGKILYLENGSMFRLELNGMEIKIGCLGGIAKEGRGANDPTSPFYTRADFRRLCNDGQDIDILLTHDSPYSTVFEAAGSKDILSFISDYQPRFHFCGHYHEPGFQLDVPGATQSFILNEVNFRKARKLNEGCMAILTIKDQDEWDVSILNEDWMREYTRDNFRYLG